MPMQTRGRAALEEGELIGKLKVTRVLLQSSDQREDETFLSHLFSGRIRVYESKLPTAKQMEGHVPVVPSPVIEERDGTVFELVSSRIDKGDKLPWGGSSYVVRWSYVETAGWRGDRQLAPIDLQAALAEVANFASLSPRKAASRLELLTSPASSGHVHQLEASDFELVEEPIGEGGLELADGCCFIPEHWLERLGVAHSLGVQVRVFAPRLGIFKGVLAARAGIDKIQLSPSMRKVPPSCAHDSAKWATLLITQHGVFPSKANVNLGKRLAGEPCNKTPYEKHASKMLEQLWVDRGVPRDVMARYKEDAVSRYNRTFGAQQKLSSESSHPLNNHASLIGLRDPTGHLPYGVFVSGLPSGAVPRGGRVFVTRFPCVKPADGQLLPLITEKPSTMSYASWQWLRTRPFGAVYFSTVGPLPIPLLCARGDLDGDLYPVCWDETILAHICELEQTDPAPAAAKPESVKPKSEVPTDDTGWLRRMQAHITSPAVLRESAEIGKYYGAWMREVQAAGMAGEDAVRLGEAFAQTLERGKHGGDIELPSYLRDRVRGVRGSRPTSSQPTGSGEPHARSPSPPLATPGMPSSALELSALSLNGLRQIIDAEGLGVKKNVGGTGRRTKVDIATDIAHARVAMGTTT